MNRYIALDVETTGLSPKTGYEVLRGNRLKSFKLKVKKQFDTDIGVGIKTQQLGIFDFRVFLNISMLLAEKVLISWVKN